MTFTDLDIPGRERARLPRPEHPAEYCRFELKPSRHPGTRCRIGRRWAWLVTSHVPHLLLHVGKHSRCNSVFSLPS